MAHTVPALAPREAGRFAQGCPGPRALLSHSCSALFSREMLMAALKEAKSVPWTILTGHVLTLHPHHGKAASLGSPVGDKSSLEEQISAQEQRLRSQDRRTPQEAAPFPAARWPHADLSTDSCRAHSGAFWPPSAICQIGSRPPTRSPGAMGRRWPSLVAAGGALIR